MADEIYSQRGCGTCIASRRETGGEECEGGER